MRGSKSSTTPRRSTRRCTRERRKSPSPASRRWWPMPSRAANIRIVASVAQKPPHFIIAQPEFKTVQDLRGARFGVLSLARGHHLFRAGSRKGHRLQARRYHHRRGRRRADPLEASARGQDRRRPATVSAELRVGGRGLQQPRRRSRNTCPTTNSPRCSSILPGARPTELPSPASCARCGAARPPWPPIRTRPRRCWSRSLAPTPDYARRAIGDALKFKLMPDGLAASEAGMRRVFTTLQRAGLVPSDQPFDMAASSIRAISRRRDSHSHPFPRLPMLAKVPPRTREQGC